MDRYTQVLKDYINKWERDHLARLHPNNTIFFLTDRIASIDKRRKALFKKAEALLDNKKQGLDYHKSSAAICMAVIEETQDLFNLEEMKLDPSNYAETQLDLKYHLALCIFLAGIFGGQKCQKKDHRINIMAIYILKTPHDAPSDTTLFDDLLFLLKTCKPDVFALSMIAFLLEQSFSKPLPKIKN